MLSDLYPLLRTVQPAELNMTLNALATALEGRGDQIGENLETVDGYLKRLNPQIPQLVEDLRLTARGLRHLRRGAAADRADPRQHGHHHRHARGPRGQAERALRRRHRLLRHRPRLPRGQRRQPDPARRGQRRAVRRLRPVLARVPLPDQGHRQRRQAPGRGVPRLHAAHRAGDAAQPAARLRPAGHSRASARTAARPASTCPTRRGPRTTRCGTSPTSTTASTSRPARAPPGWRRTSTSAPTAGTLAGERPAALAARPGLGVSAADVPDLGLLLVGPMARGAEVSLR